MFKNVLREVKMYIQWNITEQLSECLKLKKIIIMTTRDTGEEAKKLNHLHIDGMSVSGTAILENSLVVS